MWFRNGDFPYNRPNGAPPPRSFQTLLDNPASFTWSLKTSYSSRRTCLFFVMMLRRTTTNTFTGCCCCTWRKKKYLFVLQAAYLFSFFREVPLCIREQPRPPLMFPRPEWRSFRCRRFFERATIKGKASFFFSQPSRLVNRAHALYLKAEKQKEANYRVNNQRSPNEAGETGLVNRTAQRTNAVKVLH